MRDGKWKLVSDFDAAGSSWELYDMEADRTEMHDLSATLPGKTGELAKKWERWSKRAGVQPWPVKSPNASTNQPAATRGS